MKNFILTICFFFSLGISAQTNVVKMSAVKSNNYGVNYFLPKTELIIHAEYTKVTTKTGPYYKYAEKYLGVTNAVTEDKVYYTLEKVTVIPKGIPDKNQSYLVEFKSGTTAPFVYLTQDGLICTINADYEPVEDKSADKPQASASKPAINPQSVYSEELLMAGSTAKMAEIAAKQIYRLRESRTDIITGEAENRPPDGEAMKIVLQQLESQENALTSQFTGTTTTQTLTHDVNLLPEGDLEKQILFRFSKYLGVVKSDDLSGSPVYLNLKNTTEKEVPADPKEAEKIQKEKEKAKGIFYNKPGKAKIEVYFGNNKLYSGDIQIAQFGDTQILAPNIFEDKKAPVKVYFYPETGAVKQIIQ